MNIDMTGAFLCWGQVYRTPVMSVYIEGLFINFRIISYDS